MFAVSHMACWYQFSQILLELAFPPEDDKRCERWSSVIMEEILVLYISVICREKCGRCAKLGLENKCNKITARSL
jgi:hypothetical protein